MYWAKKKKEEKKMGQGAPDLKSKCFFMEVVLSPCCRVLTFPVRRVCDSHTSMGVDIWMRMWMWKWMWMVAVVSL